MKLTESRRLKQSLYDISGLNLDDKLGRMSDSQFESYWGELDSFTENFPEHEGKLRSALAAKDYNSLSEHLESMKNLLDKIHADDMAKDCQMQIYELASIDHEKLEANINNFLANVTLLSIDLQMLTIKFQKNEEDAPPDKSAGKEGEKNILAVDDQAVFLSTLKSYLQGTRYKLTCTASCKTALDYLKNNRPDLFILDIMMPEMDGYELAQKIRERGQKAPIIFLTGNASKDAVLKAILAGGGEFIVKPASREQVIARVSKFV